MWVRRYILYTADHGFHLGQFRMPYFKAQPYDSDLNVPMMVRGPGIRAGAVLTDHIGLNIDIAPTIAALVGTTPPPDAVVDGRCVCARAFIYALVRAFMHALALPGGGVNRWWVMICIGSTTMDQVVNTLRVIAAVGWADLCSRSFTFCVCNPAYTSASAWCGCCGWENNQQVAYATAIRVV